MSIQDILRRLQDVKQLRDGSWMARCPCHDDRHPSLHITESGGKTLLHCFAGCSFEQLRRALGLTENPAWAAIVATYDYKDETGKLLYQVVRLYPKSFRIRVPRGPDSWEWSLERVEKRVLYRLPDILARPGETVFVVEGEKDADRLAKEGLLATTNLGGAGKWRPEYSRTLAGRDVVILPDNDPPGQLHAQKVATSLHGLARSIKIVDLPGLPPKGDISDWLDAGHTIGELLELAKTAPLWTISSTTSCALEGSGRVFTYRMPAYGIRINLRAVKLHSDGRLTALIRIFSDTGERIAGSGAINLAAVSTRNAFARDLEQDRPDVPWRAELNTLYQMLQDRILTGEPRITLRSNEAPDPVVYLVPPLLPEHEPTIIYGDGGSGKSLFAMLISIIVATGTYVPSLGLAAPEPRNVLYLDWERSPNEAKRRLYRLAKGLNLKSPANLFYRRCTLRLADDVDAIADIIHEDEIGLLIVDSLLPAAGVQGETGGDPAGPAAALFEAIRLLNTTALLIAHHGKNRERGVYGSIFYRNLASSVWSARAYSEPGGTSISLGLIHEKANVSNRFPPLGVQFIFDDTEDGRGPITVNKIDVDAIPDAVEALPLTTRILELLEEEGPMSTQELARALNVPENRVRARCSDLQHQGKLERDGGNWALPGRKPNDWRSWD